MDRLGVSRSAYPFLHFLVVLWRVKRNPKGNPFCKEVIFVELKTFALSLGAGMALGAAAILMMPRQNKVRRAMQRTADCIEDTIDDSLHCMRRC